MTFKSILFDQEYPMNEPSEAPDCLGDLNLDQVIDYITAEKKEYNLKPFYYTPLHDPENIYYRQEVMRDLENPSLITCIDTFTEKMATMRRYLSLSEKLDFNYHKKGWFLESAHIYCEAVANLEQSLSLVNPKSHGFQAFRRYLENYVHSKEFRSLKEGMEKVKDGLSNVKYCVIIQSGKFSVRKYRGEIDYSAEVEKTFAKFRKGKVKDYRVDIFKGHGMNHIEAQILDFVSRLYPEEFAALDQFCEQFNDFVDPTIRDFDREIQFYVTYLEFIAKFKAKGLPFCYPQVCTDKRKIYAREAFDLALAHSLLYTPNPVICNDFSLNDPERIIVVSGPNQGGKTTFSRMFGQLHYLASLGCPVPGKEARLFLYDRIFTHFEKQEDIRNLRGKLQDDMVRIHDILRQATPESILLVNEIFLSTTWDDALYLSTAIMRKAEELDLLCVWVTFIDELSTLSKKIISMVSTVLPENPAIRTYKIIRKPADGMAYALSIARKHGLTYEQIKERIKE